MRDVPPVVRDELAHRAERSGRSMQGYLREQLIELVERPDLDEVLARARQRARVSGSHLDAGTVVELRDHDRR